MAVYRVLVVDDYPDITTALSRLLASFGHECACATSGLQAIEVARTFAFDLGLVDLGLPDLSGFDVGRKLRELAGDRPIFLTAISGWAGPDDRARSSTAGFDHHVLKPLDGGVVKRILQLAERVLGAQAAAHSSRNR